MIAHTRDAAPRTITRGLARRDAATLPGAAALFFRFPVPRIFAASALLWAGIRVWLGGFGAADLAIALGVAVYWPLQEWFLHWKVLHFRPREAFGVRIDPWFARVHRWHHRHPDVLERVFLPTELIAVLTPIHWVLWPLVAPTWGLAATGIVAMTTAALVYEWVHYLVHTPYRPRSAWYARIRRNHMLHHFKNERYWHAFTVPHVDALFGTDPDPETVERSPTARTLGVD